MVKVIYLNSNHEIIGTDEYRVPQSMTAMANLHHRLLNMAKEGNPEIEFASIGSDVFNYKRGKSNHMGWLNEERTEYRYFGDVVGKWTEITK